MKPLRTAIVAMSACAVVSDAVLIAFYPQFFERRYGVTSALHVGAYVAAISIAVMCTLPLWARLARRIDTLRLLLFTQGAAGTLCLASGLADDVLGYWLLTIPMFMCKSSYLLMYPYLMRMQPPATHAHTIGLLSVVVHVGGILAAGAGGHVMQHAGPAACVGLMAAGDFAQMAVCGWLLRGGHAAAAEPAAAPEAPASRDTGRWRRVLPLCALVMLFDFSAYLIRPFFSLHWAAVSGSGDQLVAGLVFAIPGGVALAALVVNQRLRARGRRLPDAVFPNLLLGAAGLLLQAGPAWWAVLLGRVLFGWALFQLVVKLEVLLFRLSAPERYARDFSVFNFFQNFGVLLASFAAGALVERHGLAITFAVAVAGFAASALLERLLLPDRAPAALPLAGGRHAA